MNGNGKVLHGFLGKDNQRKKAHRQFRYVFFGSAQKRPYFCTLATKIVANT